MPSAQQSRASSHRNVVSYRARYTAYAIEVTKENQQVAFHFQTSEGVVFVRADLSEFVQKCRGPVDHNLNPLPSFDDVASGDAQTLRFPDLPPEALGNQREMSEEQRAKYRAALADYRAGRFKTKRAACAYHNIDHLYQGFVSWSKKPAQQEQLTDGNQAPVLKPGGRLL